MNHDELIIKTEIIDEKIVEFLKLNLNKDITNFLKRNHQDIYDKVNTFCPLLNEYPFKQKIYWYINKITNFPKCDVCGANNKRNITSFALGYNLNVCSHKCASNHPSNIEKKRQTCFKHYGVNNPGQSNIIKEKMLNTTLKIYGVNNASQSDIIKTQKKKTCMNHYGVDHPLKIKEVKERIKALYDKGIPQEKSYATKKTNGTLGGSKSEKKLYNLIREKYPDVVYHHKDNEYPFVCDFFIPSINSYIELNFTWLHGKGPYLNSLEQQKQIKIWENKSKEINFKGEEKTSYKDAIYIWSKRDPMKKQHANDNNLNLLCFYNEEEFFKWFNIRP